MTHPHATLLLSSASHDPSFPSDHATAAFAIAFTVLAFSRLVGFAFLATAVAIAFSRVLVGLHYPGDVLAGVAVGFVAAALVVTAGRTAVARAVGVVSRLTDPLLRPAWRLVPRYRPQVLVGLVLLVSLYAFGQLAEDTAQRESIVKTDHRLAAWIHAHAPDALVDPVRVFTLLGGVVFLALVTFVAVVALIRRRRYEAAALMVACFAGGELLNTGLKVVFHRARPHFAHPLAPVPDSYSFPSGHASVSVAVYGALALILAGAVQRTSVRVVIATAASSLAVLIGASRVVLDVHYLSDVLAGFSVGVAWLCGCLLALLTFRRGPGRIRRRGLVRSSARAAP
jgi:undecaprenyl-diphosphatase